MPTLESCVSDIIKWMVANVLLLNSDKTGMLVLGPKKQKYLLFDLTINLDIKSQGETQMQTQEADDWSLTMFNNPKGSARE
jgi:hypothetical protein